MKPRILRCGLDFKYPKEIIGHQHDNWPELQTMPVNHEDWSFPDLIECASLNGYKVANTNVLNGAHFLPLNGSVGCHVDEAFYGITIACLAYYDVFCEMPQLVTRLGWLDLKQGDVFIFDATKWHGWISNGECLLALINVRKTRKRTAHPVR